MRDTIRHQSRQRAHRGIAAGGALALTAGMFASAAATAPSAAGAPAAGAPAADARPAPSGTPTQYSPDPAAAERDANARSALGTHTIQVVGVYWGDSAPEALDPTAIGTVVRDASSYYRAATASKITASLGQVQPWAKITLSETEADSCDLGAIEAQVRTLIPAPSGSNSHLEIVFPESSACDFTALSQRGTSAAGDGVSFYNGPDTFTWSTLAFGIGTNAGLGMSHALDCWNDAQHTTAVPQSAFCKRQDGGDPWDVMGWAPYGQLGMPSAVNLRRLGVLSESEFPELTPGSGQYAFVRPLTARSGQRGFAVTLGRHRYTVEYRTPDGLDDWIDDASWTDPAGVSRSDPGGGVVVRYQDLDSDEPWNTEVLDFHPDGVVADEQRHPGLEEGESWSSPGNLMRLEVVDTTDSGATVKVDFLGLDKVSRWAGDDRYSTSASISAKVFSPGVPVVYVASGAVYSDALSGAPVAGKDKGPILLVERDRIPGAVQAELRRLIPGRIVVLGGPASVSDEVANRLGSYATTTVERWAGDDRFSASAAISAKAFPTGVATAYIASGRIYTDALSGAPVAGKNANPVLLVDTSSVPNEIQTELRRLNPARIVVLGGPTTITPNVLTKLEEFTTGSVIRWSGPDRFSTSATISEGNYGPGVPVLYVASGRVFPDALSGAPVAGLTRGPILLVDTNAIAPSVDAEIERLQPKRIVILGGPNSVTENVRVALGSYLP